MSDSENPLVSIGMPLYNEAEFLEKSIRSIMDQKYGNIEIIISDNGSTDETFSICENLLGGSGKAELHRSTANRGAAENFRFVLDKARGRYFMWASGHDLWEPDYLDKTIAALEAEPDAVIAFGSSTWIDENGDSFGRHFGYTDTRGLPVLSRFFTVYYGNMNPILGVIRKASLDQVDALLSAVGGDLILLSQLALIGDFLHVPEVSWYRREFRHETNHSEKLRRYRSGDYALSRSLLDRMFPLLRLPFSLIRNVLTSDLRAIEKTAAVWSLLGSLPVRYLAGKKL